MNTIDTKAAKIELASKLAGEYKLRGYHCSESIIRACSEVMGLSLSTETIRAACGFRGGGGGYRDRCGVIESGCMLISILHGRLTPEKADWDYCYLIRLLHDRFNEHFGSIYCRDILPEERKKDGPICIRVYTEGAGIVTKLLLEARDILDAVPPEERR